MFSSWGSHLLEKVLSKWNLRKKLATKAHLSYFSWQAVTMVKVSHPNSQLNSEHPFCDQKLSLLAFEGGLNTHSLAISFVLWWACLRVLICFMYFGVICLIFARLLHGIFVTIHCKYAHIIYNWHMWNRCRATESNRNVNSNCKKTVTTDLHFYRVAAFSK